MYRIYFSNHGYYSGRRFDTVNEAIAYAKMVGFEAAIHLFPSKQLVASWSSLYGTKIY